MAITWDKPTVNNTGVSNRIIWDKPVKTGGITWDNPLGDTQKRGITWDKPLEQSVQHTVPSGATRSFNAPTTTEQPNPTLVDTLKSGAKQIGRDVVGTGEAFTKLASGVVGFPPAMIAEATGGPEVGSKRAEKISKAMTYEPKLQPESAEIASNIIEAPFKALGWVKEKFQELGRKNPDFVAGLANHPETAQKLSELFTKNPELADQAVDWATSVGFDSALVALGGKGVKSIKELIKPKRALNEGDAAASSMIKERLAKKTIDQYVDEINSLVGPDRTTNPGIYDRTVSAIDRFRNDWYNDAQMLEKAEKDIRGVKRLDPQKIDPATSPSMLRTESVRTGAAKAYEMMMNGTFDFAKNKTGESLRDVFGVVNKDNYKDVVAYLESKQALLDNAKGMEQPFNLETAQKIVENFDPKFGNLLERITAFEDRILDYLVDAGGLTAEAKATIRANNPIHVPFKKVLENQYGSGLSGKIANVGDVIKKKKGSTLRNEDPIKLYIEQTANIIGAADRIRIGRELANLADLAPNNKWIRKVGSPKDAKNIVGETLDDALDADRIAQKTLDKDNIVSFIRNGKREFYEIAPELQSVLTSVGNYSLPAELDFFLGKPTRAVRMGSTGFRPAFSLRNLFKDIFTTAMQTSHGSGVTAPLRALRGIVRKVGGGEINDLYRRSGVNSSHLISLDKKGMKQAVGDILASDAKSKAMNVIKHPVEAMKEIIALSEVGPRLGEFEAALKKGEQLYGKGTASARIYASNAASEGSTNFRRMGRLGKAVNQIIPFFNSSLQGPARMAKYAQEHPVAFMGKGLGYITVPTISLWMMNKDEQWYKELPAWDKYGFWHIKTDDTHMRLPIPFTWGTVFKALPELALNQMNEYNPEELKIVLSDLLRNETPSVGVAAVKPPIENWFNKSIFTGREIVPYYTEKTKAPEDQFTDYTTETSKKIGKLLGYSPAKIDNLLSGYSGGMATDLIKIGESFGKNKIEQKADIPVVGGFFQREYDPKKRKDIIEYNRSELKSKLRERYKKNKGDALRDMAIWNNKYPRFKIKQYELRK